jgi:hypothetical protein
MYCCHLSRINRANVFCNSLCIETARHKWIRCILKWYETQEKPELYQILQENNILFVRKHTVVFCMALVNCGHCIHICQIYLRITLTNSYCYMLLWLSLIFLKDDL